MAGKGITFLALLLLLHLTVDTGAVSPFVHNDRNATNTAAALLGDDIVSSRPLLDSDDLMRSTSSIGEEEPAEPAAVAAAGTGSGAGFNERFTWKSFLTIDSSQQGSLRRLDSDSNTPGVAVYIAVFVVAVVLFLVCLRACGVGVICIPISCC